MVAGINLPVTLRTDLGRMNGGFPFAARRGAGEKIGRAEGGIVHRVVNFAQFFSDSEDSKDGAFRYPLFFQRWNLNARSTGGASRGHSGLAFFSHELMSVRTGHFDCHRYPSIPRGKDLPFGVF